MPKFKIVFVKKEFEALFVVRILTIRKIEPTLTLGKKKFVLNVNQPCYISKQIPTFFLNIDSGSQLNFSELKPFLNPEELDTLTENKMIAEITKGLMDTTKEKIVFAILGAIMGALIAAVIAMMYYTKKIQDILSEYTLSPDMIIPDTTPPAIFLLKNIIMLIIGG